MTDNWEQITTIGVAIAVSLGSAIGLPIANALRRPAIQKAIEKEVDASSGQLAARDDDQQRELASLKSEVALLKLELGHLKNRQQFCEQAVLSWKPRKDEIAPDPLLEGPA